MFAFFLNLLCISFHSAPAFAHSALLASDPADGAVIQAAPANFSLTFNEPVSPLVLKIVRPDGSSRLLDHYELKDATLVIEAPALGNGTHVLVWRVVSADGHPVGGSLVFSLGAPSAGGAPPAAETAEAADRSVQFVLWVVKVGLYAGLFLGVGGVFFQSWIAASPGARTFSLAMLWLGLVAAALSVGAQGLDALRLPLTAFAEPAVWRAGFGTSFGNTAVLAAASLVVAAVSPAMPGGAVARPLSLIALAGAGLALVASGHAADAEPHWLTRPAVFLHGVCIAFWAGALGPLAGLLARGGPAAAPALRRFSRLIPYPLGGLTVAGVALAVVQVESPEALVSTGYGRVLLAKLAILAALFALAARNRWRLTAAAASGGATAAAPLVRAIRLEIMLVCAVFAVAALWRFTPPPRVLAIAAAVPATVHIHADKAMAELSVSPGHAGRVVVSIFVLNAAFDPLAAKEVTLVLSNPAAGIEPIRRPARQLGGAWRVDDLTVPLPGRWKVRLDVLVSDFEMVRLQGEIAIRP